MSFVLRKSIGENIYAVRIFCEYNYQSDKNLQYTLTILPAFIQPYARRTTNKIIAANLEYINAKTKSYQEAAFLMGAENIKSFIRYYSRIADRIDQWIIQLIQKISEITNINNYKRLPFKEKSLKEKMQYFFKITKQYISVIDKLDSGVVVTKDNYILFILAVFSLSIKSLGP